MKNKMLSKKNFEAKDIESKDEFCQAQPQLQLSWAELALTSNSTPTTHPPDHPQKK